MFVLRETVELMLAIMVSRSCLNLLEIAGGDVFNSPQTSTTLPRVITAAGIFSKRDGGESNDEDVDAPLSVNWKKTIIAANFLALNAQKDLKSGSWSFSFDEDSILLEMKDGFSTEMDVIYVGCLRADVNTSEQEVVSQKLLDEFNCVPTFIAPDIYRKYYHGFCKHQLWPLFHYMLHVCPDHGDHFDKSLWQAYYSAKWVFAEKVMEVLNLEDDYVWVHDYHLMLLPTFLRRRFN